MDNKTLTLNEAASLLLGAGLVQVAANVGVGLTLVVLGAIIKIGVAVLDKYGIVVSGKPRRPEQE